MDYYTLWAEYQRLRRKYPTDDVTLWSKKDAQRACEIREITSELSSEEIYASFAKHIEGAKKPSALRQMMRRLFRRGSV